MVVQVGLKLNLLVPFYFLYLLVSNEYNAVRRELAEQSSETVNVI